MTDPVIQVEKLSKRYRIGLQQAQPASAAGALLDILQRPLKNLHNLMRLSRFGKQDEADVFWALRDISFEVQQGEVLGIIGRNGAGKSTLLKILSRITLPTSGWARLRGRVSSLLEVGTGFNPELTGRENVYLNGTILGMRKAEVDRKFAEIVEFSGVEKFIDTPVKRYSSGMRVRLAFAVAAHLEPEILIIDEVLAVGDAEFQKKCLGKMGDVASSGRTVLFVSHNMAAVQNLCQRAILLDAGRCVSDGATQNIIADYLQTIAEVMRFSLHEREDRKGTGDLRFTGVGLYNKEHQEVTSFVCGQDAVLVLRFQNYTQHSLKNLVINLGLDNQVDQRITLLSNELTGHTFPTVPTEVDRIEIVIPRMPLKPGRYKFTLFGTINGIIADWIQNAGFFDVEPGDYYGTGKLPPLAQGDFLIDHQFRISSNTVTMHASLP